MTAECPCELFDRGPDTLFHRLSEDGQTAIYRADEPEWYEVKQVKHLEEPGPSNTSEYTEKKILEERADLIARVEYEDVVVWVSDLGVSLSTVKCDHATAEILVPLSELWSRYREIMNGTRREYFDPW